MDTNVEQLNGDHVERYASKNALLTSPDQVKLAVGHQLGRHVGKGRTVIPTKHPTAHAGHGDT